MIFLVILNSDTGIKGAIDSLVKIKPEHFEHIKAAIAPLADKIPAHREALKNDARVKDLGMRVRWDALYAAGLSGWICSNLYSYMNDTHIDTALRQVFTDLNLN